MRSAMYLVESSRSLATLMASFPVSFCMFCDETLIKERLQHRAMANLDVRLDFCPNLLKMLNDGTFNGTSQISVLIRDKASFVSDSIIDVLRPAITTKR